MATSQQYKHFDPKQYLSQYFEPSAKDWEVMVLFQLDELHEIFSSGKIRGGRLLDIGTGPSIHSIISASQYFKEIYLTDYAEQNLTFLRSWWNSNQTIQDRVVEYVLNKEANGESKETRNSQIKKKIKAITSIDVTTSPIWKTKELPVAYDVITSCDCLDSAVNSKKDYMKCIANIKPLLKKGGILILTGDINESYYTVGNSTFQCLEINGEEIRCIYEESGFKVKYWKEIEETSCRELKHSNSQGVFVMVAENSI